MHYQRILANGSLEKREVIATCTVDGCSNKHRSKGLCSAHYSRMLKHGNLNVLFIVKNDRERLIANTLTNENGCYVWRKSKYNGYGKTVLKGVLMAAHRASWIVFKGDIPSGMQVNHKCHNRACINVDHLYIGNQKQNMDDMYSAKREVVLKGSSHGGAKINEKIALEIFNRKGFARQIAKDFGVSETLVYSIKKKKNWKHIHNE